MRYQAQAQAKAWIRIPCPASTQTLAMSTREDSITQPLGREFHKLRRSRTRRRQPGC